MRSKLQLESALSLKSSWIFSRECFAVFTLIYLQHTHVLREFLAKYWSRFMDEDVKRQYTCNECGFVSNRTSKGNGKTFLVRHLETEHPDLHGQYLNHYKSRHCMSQKFIGVTLNLIKQ